MKAKFYGWEVRQAAVSTAHKVCALLKLPVVKVIWDASVSTAAMSEHGAMYLADLDDAAIVPRSVLERYVGYVIHELLHRKYTDWSVHNSNQYISTLHNAVEDIWIERLAIAAELTGNIEGVLTVLVTEMVKRSLAEVTDWSDPQQYPYVLAIYGRRYAPKVPMAAGLEPIFLEASTRIDSCKTSKDTMAIAIWVYGQLNQIKPPKPETGKPSDQGDKPSDQGDDQTAPDGPTRDGKGEGKGDGATGPAKAPTQGGKQSVAVEVEPQIDAPDYAAGIGGCYSEGSTLLKEGAYLSKTQDWTI